MKSSWWIWQFENGFGSAGPLTWRSLTRVKKTIVVTFAMRHGKNCKDERPWELNKTWAIMNVSLGLHFSWKWRLYCGGFSPVSISWVYGQKRFTGTLTFVDTRNSGSIACTWCNLSHDQAGDRAGRPRDWRNHGNQSLHHELTQGKDHSKLLFRMGFIGGASRRRKVFGLARQGW
jgi:hypothetical protein